MHQSCLIRRRRVSRVDDRRVLNGIFWVLRSGSPWRDMPERYRRYQDRKLKRNFVSSLTSRMYNMVGLLRAILVAI